MIVVTIELWPGGRGEDRQSLGCVTIANDGTGTPTVGHYRAVLGKRNWAGVWKEVEVKAFPRKRLGAYDLLYRVLSSAVGNRNIA